MRKTYHLSLSRYIFYACLLWAILFSSGLLVALIVVGLMSDASIIALAGVFLVIAIVYFYFMVIHIQDDHIMFSQKMGLKRIYVDIHTISKIILKDYKPKHDARFIRPGYKLTLKGSNTSIKIIKGQYSKASMTALFEYIIAVNPDITLNKRMQEERRLAQK